MNFSDQSTALLAAGGGDTVKLFDVTAESSGGDPCVLSYTPSPGSQLNTLKWNHTNLVVVSAGEDKKISLWRKNGQSMGTIPVAGSENAEAFEESVMALSFSSKSSRYLCTGGSGQVVRIWDLQKKRCIKRLRGHTNTITGAMYNCKDEYLASISLSGDLILHNLASGQRAADLKDPNGQVLRVLDYSRSSRHLLVTAGDDGSVHLWDTTGRSPKISWLKQHSAPTAGVSFSPSNDKIIATVGLDKKLYTFDTGSRRPSFCISYEAPFSSLAFRDGGNILAAGTNTGKVVFYDVRGKPQPFTVLRAYGNSEAVTSLCWQRSKPVLVNENCTAETALLGSAIEDSILMPDPLPSATSSNASSYTTIAGSQNPGRLIPSLESSTSTGEETPLRSSLKAGGNLARLRPARTQIFKDDMDVFSPLVDVQPITPSVDKLWDEHGRKDLLGDKKASIFPSSRRFPISQEGGNDIHPLFDWKPSSTSKQDEIQSFQQPGSTPAASTKTDDLSSITPSEAWGGERISDKLAHHRQSVNHPSRFATLAPGSLSSFSGSQDFAPPSASPSSISYQTSSTSTLTNFRHRDISDSDTPLVVPDQLTLSPTLSLTTRSIARQSNSDTPLVVPDQLALSPTLSLTTRSITGQSNFDTLGTLPRRFSTYAERISTAPAFSDGTSFSTSSPKTKKTGAETREELNSFLLRSDTGPAVESRIPSSANGGVSQPQRVSSQPDSQQGSSFTLQLFQRSLEETLAPIQKAFRDDIRNLHIEVLRQAHMQQMEYSGTLSVILENQSEIMRRLESMEIAVQQLRQSL